MMWARSSGDGAGNAVLGWPSVPGSSTSTTARPRPSSRERKPAVVTAAIGAASTSMNSTRASGTAGSIGRYAAPDLSTARIATMASADRENSSATHRPGPAPRPNSKCANRFDASSSSRYVSDRPSQLTATACGVRATCSANNSRNRHRRHRLGQHRPITELIQLSVLTVIEQIDRQQPPARIGSHRRQHPLQPSR